MRCKHGHPVVKAVQDASGDVWGQILHSYTVALCDLSFVTIQTDFDSRELRQLPKNYPLIKLVSHSFGSLQPGD